MPLVSKGTVTGAAQQGQCSHAAHWLATLSYNVPNTTVLEELQRNRCDTDSGLRHSELLIDLQAVRFLLFCCRVALSKHVRFVMFSD